MKQYGSKYFAGRRPRPWGQKIKIQLIQKMIMLHIKIKGKTLQQHGSKYVVHRPPQ